MKLTVGLGNPGRRYQGTRHNVGARVIETLARRHGVALREEGWAEAGALRLNGRRALLARPHTYVNVSGAAVADLRRRHRVALENLLVVYDDLDLPVGQVRVRAQGGHGGHNGMRSIIETLGERAFPRLRIGIGRPPAGVDPAEYVLSRFSPAEVPAVEAAVERGADAVELFIRRGIEAAMNAFNLHPARSSHNLHEGPYNA
ncbi:MAG TPA: aminoacyl-tRNA hydrolase [bacterium]|jgi:PTH1 family peptidyl-tRNA hydrolase|nr:aminoacyl-tRNA hydrolase [bacterium]